MNIAIALVIVVACLALGAIAMRLFVEQRAYQRRLRAHGIIPLGWGMKIYPMKPLPSDKRK